MKETELFIVGATFAAIGIADALGKQTVIAEETCVLGTEFAAAFNQKEPKKITCFTESGKTLEKQLAMRGLLNPNGEIYAQPAVFVLAKACIRQQIQLHFNTLVTEIKKLENGYKVTLFNCDGYQTILAKQVIDTTSTGVFKNKKREKWICSAVAQNGQIKNEITDMQYIPIPLAESEGWVEARKKTLAYAKEKNAKIVMIANAFCYRDRVQPTEQEGVLWIPSDGFYNLLDAYEGGAAYVQQGI